MKRQLREMGYFIDDSTFKEDTKKGIDFWWYMLDEKWHSVQLKKRQSGDDLIHELIYNVDTMQPGRDVLGISEYTLWTDREQVGRLVLTDYLRNLTEETWLPTYRAKPYRSWWGGEFWEMWKLLEKGESGQFEDERWKVVAFVKPDPADILWEGQFSL